MEECQEGDSSSDEERQTIDDDDMEDSPTDSPDLWMPERNDDDTIFERALTDAIPTKKHPQAVSELSIVQQRKKQKGFRPIMLLLTHSRQSGYVCAPESVWLAMTSQRRTRRLWTSI
jgi:hypothetical protein